MDVIKLIKQDIKVAESYLINRKFHFINTIGNRILQNLFAINNKEFMVVGLVLKEIALDLQQIEAAETKHEKTLDKCIPIAQECLSDITLHLSHENFSFKIWNSYIDFEDKIRKYLLIPKEREIYKDNREFSKIATISYLNTLISHKELLFNRDIILLERTRSELALLINIYSGKYIIVSYLLLRSFEHVYRYLLYGKVADEELESFVNTNYSRLSEIVTLIQGEDMHKLIELADIMVSDLMFSYRKYFMFFGELKGEFVEELPLPPDVSEKIRNIIDKHRK